MLRDPSKPIHPKLAGVQRALDKVWKREDSARRRAKPVQHEAAEQRAFVEWLELKGIPFFAVPNGSHLSGSSAGARAYNGAKLKALGVWPGAPDIVIVRMSPNHGKPVAIEMKRGDGKGVVSAEQRECHSIMRGYGWIVIIAYGAQGAIDAMRSEGY